MSFAGLMNNTCTIQKTTRAQDATTGEWNDTWADSVLLVKCRLDMSRGGEVRTVNDELLKVTHILYMDYRADLNWWEYRIKVSARGVVQTFNIIRISDGGGKHHHLEIDLELVK